MLKLTNTNAMILMTEFEKAGEGDQKRFLELPQAEARQLKRGRIFLLKHLCNCFVTCTLSNWRHGKAQRNSNILNMAHQNGIWHFLNTYCRIKEVKMYMIYLEQRYVSK